MFLVRVRTKGRMFLGETPELSGFGPDNLLLNLKGSFFEPTLGSSPNLARKCG